MIEIRMKAPGSARYMVEDFDDFMQTHNKKLVYVVRNQREKDVLDGYGLIYGSELPIMVGEHKVDPSSAKPQFFLWVVEIEELS